MTKEQRIQMINDSWIKMEQLQDLIDTTTNERDLKLYRAMYEAFHSVYMILTDDRMKEKRRAAERRE